MTVIVGLDLSLTSAGVAALPMNWDCDPSRVRVETVKHCHPEHANDDDRGQRLATHARRVLAVARALAGQEPICWGIESLPTHNAHALVPLAELAGAVRMLLSDAGARVLTVPQASARKLLLGKLPRKDVKEIVRQTVVSFAGCGHWQPDEVDAFVVANWLASECGGVALAA